MERDREPHMTDKVTPSNGNVFADLGLPEAAAELVKAELTYQLAKRIKTLGLTQATAARRLGISQPDVSRLMKNRPQNVRRAAAGATQRARSRHRHRARPASAPPHTAKVRILEECA